MTWNAVFPQGNTLISQSVTQIQTNWSYLATIIGTDHVFNTYTANDGHHKFGQMITQAADVTPFVGANPSALALYAKNNNAPNVKLWCNTTTGGVRQLQTTITTQVGPLNNGGVLVALNGTEQFQNGIIIVSSLGTRTAVAISYISYNGAIILAPIINTDVGLFSITQNSTNVEVSNSAPDSYIVSLLRMEL